MSKEVPDSSADPNFTFLKRDIPAPLVDTMLDRQQASSDSEAINETIQVWDKLKAKPNLRHYIAATSYEIAPINLLLRQKITSTLLELLVLLDEAVTNERLEDLLADSDTTEPLLGPSDTP